MGVGSNKKTVKLGFNLKMINPDATTEMVSNKVYLQGIIYYQDDETAVIIYVDEAGKTANRIMTCIDIKTGKEKWKFKSSHRS